MEALDRGARKVLIGRLQDQRREARPAGTWSPVTGPGKGVSERPRLKPIFDGRGRKVAAGEEKLAASVLAERGPRSAAFVARALAKRDDSASEGQRSADQNNRACALLLANAKDNLAEAKKLLTELTSWKDKSHAEENLERIRRSGFEAGS